MFQGSGVECLSVTAHKKKMANAKGAALEKLRSSGPELKFHPKGMTAAQVAIFNITQAGSNLLKVEVR